ncbi:MAG: DUF2064 domain-containing protein [Hyphomicrobiaceae bacterium]
MAKVPVAGRVKTRLARQIGVSAALRFYRTTSAALLARLARQPFWETHLAITPNADARSRVFPADVRRLGQGSGDLGARMQRPMRVLPPGPVCVIGTDIPDIRVADIRAAFHVLGSRDVVFGPAEDGGFWLVGQRRRPRLIEPYAGVRWSHADTLADVLANLRGVGDGVGAGIRVGVGVGFTTTLSDVDAPADLTRHAHLIGRRV